MLIYPARRLILLCAAGAPIALLIAGFAPSLWLLGPAWVVAVVGLAFLDAAFGAARHRLQLTIDAPAAAGMGSSPEVEAQLRFDGGAGPARVQASLEANERLEVSPERGSAIIENGRGRAVFVLRPLRRGDGRVERLWLRWLGPMGLVWKQRVETLDRPVAVTPNIAQVQEDAARMFSRTAPFGQRVQQELGEGSEFHALQEFRPGHDRRAIDWKRSATHGKLLAREHRVERNHPLILCLDAGRTMSEPVAGQPRIDRALTAALTLAYAGLKLGDRVGLFAFDAKPRVTSGQVAGVQSFPLLQQLAARVDYSTEEANYTLALTELSGELQRRSLVVVFTEVADLTQAELMLENVGRLLKKHVVLFVSFRDEELEALAAQEPETTRDVSRAVVAASLLRQREAVLARLRRMGVEVVDAPARRVGPKLLNAYLDVKRRELV